MHQIIAHHPLTETPYNKLVFVGANQHGTPLYRVMGLDRPACAAPTALRSAFRRYGGQCFYCSVRLKTQQTPSEMSLDHLVAQSSGGTHLLHNLVLACKACNKSKHHQHLPNFNSERAATYLRALEVHIADCIKSVAEPGTALR